MTRAALVIFVFVRNRLSWSKNTYLFTSISISQYRVFFLHCTNTSILNQTTSVCPMKKNTLFSDSPICKPNISEILLFLFMVTAAYNGVRFCQWLLFSLFGMDLKSLSIVYIYMSTCLVALFTICFLSLCQVLIYLSRLSVNGSEFESRFCYHVSCSWNQELVTFEHWSHRSNINRNPPAFPIDRFFNIRKIGFSPVVASFLHHITNNKQNMYVV